MSQLIIKDINAKVKLGTLHNSPQEISEGPLTEISKADNILEYQLTLDTLGHNDLGKSLFLLKVIRIEQYGRDVLLLFSDLSDE